MSGKSHISTKSSRNFSYRPPKHLETLLGEIIAVTRRNKASILHEGLELTLPELEKRHASALAKFRRTNR